MKCFAVHSYKGGTGKTTLAANLAVIYARMGHDVVLLELDFQAPSLHTLFGVRGRDAYMNDYLSESATWDDVLVDLGDNYDLDGLLVLGFSNPDVDEIRKQLAKDRKWHMQAISQLLVLKERLRAEGFDYVIFDSAPGVHYSSVNAVVASDFTVVVAKIDNFDFDGSIALIDQLYNPLERRAFMLFNKVVPPLLTGSRPAISTAEEVFKDKAEILGFVPCYCDVPLAMGSEIQALSQPDGPFATRLQQVAQKIAEIDVAAKHGT